MKPEITKMAGEDAIYAFYVVDYSSDRANVCSCRKSCSGSGYCTPVLQQKDQPSSDTTSSPPPFYPVNYSSTLANERVEARALIKAIK